MFSGELEVACHDVERTLLTMLNTLDEFCNAMKPLLCQWLAKFHLGEDVHRYSVFAIRCTLCWRGRKKTTLWVQHTQIRSTGHELNDTACFCYSFCVVKNSYEKNIRQAKTRDIEVASPCLGITFLKLFTKELLSFRRGTCSLGDQASRHMLALASSLLLLG